MRENPNFKIVSKQSSDVIIILRHDPYFIKQSKISGN